MLGWGRREVGGVERKSHPPPRHREGGRAVFGGEERREKKELERIEEEKWEIYNTGKSVLNLFLFPK
jgi:hypothetical protein